MDFNLQSSTGEIESVYNFTSNGQVKAKKKNIPVLQSAAHMQYVPLEIWNEGAQGAKITSYTNMNKTISYKWRTGTQMKAEGNSVHGHKE